MIVRSATSRLLALSALWAASVASADGYSLVFTDTVGDAMIRETSSAGVQHFNEHALPDLKSLTFTAWEAFSPASDPYDGQPVSPSSAHLVRIDLELAGLFNPPGPLGLGGTPYNPYKFGDRPVFGFIEIDLDDNIDSGGELQNIARFRFLANAGRFGGLPEGPIGARVAKSADDYDGAFFTPPQFERNGAEMSIVLCGCFEPILVSETGNGNGIFEAGETMIVSGRFLERFQALAPYSGVFGGSDFGLYDPEVRLRFKHEVEDDITTITLVYGLDAIGAAQLAGQSVQPLDNIVSNHTSVAEMLRDIILSASGCCGPIFSDPVALELSQEWISPSFPDVSQIEKDLKQYLDPTKWNARALVGTAYATPQSGLYIWTDLGFDWRFADLNHDGLVDGQDAAILADALEDLDGSTFDASGRPNGMVIIPNFGANFSLYDLTGDGVIDQDDLAVYDMGSQADLTGDGGVDGADLAILLANWGYCPGCPADINGDGYVNGADIAILLANWGPVNR